MSTIDELGPRQPLTTEYPLDDSYQDRIASLRATGLEGNSHAGPMPGYTPHGGYGDRPIPDEHIPPGPHSPSYVDSGYGASNPYNPADYGPVRGPTLPPDEPQLHPSEREPYARPEGKHDEPRQGPQNVSDLDRVERGLGPGMSRIFSSRSIGRT